MSALGLSKDRFAWHLWLDCGWWYKERCPSVHVSNCTININAADEGCPFPRISYYASEADTHEDNQVVLDFWDRQSFREAYRYARSWCYEGIGPRIMGGPRC